MAFGSVQEGLKRTASSVLTSIKSLTFLAILNRSWWKRKWEYFNRFEMLSSWIIFLWADEMQHCMDTLCSHGLPLLKKHSYQARSRIFKWLLYYFSLVIVPLRGLHRRKSVDQQNAAAIAEPLCRSVWRYKYEQCFAESHPSLFWGHFLSRLSHNTKDKLGSQLLEWSRE